MTQNHRLHIYICFVIISHFDYILLPNYYYKRVLLVIVTLFHFDTNLKHTIPYLNCSQVLNVAILCINLQNYYKSIHLFIPRTTIGV